MPHGLHHKECSTSDATLRITALRDTLLRVAPLRITTLRFS